LLQDAKATVKAKPKKPNLNAFFIFIIILKFLQSYYLPVNTQILKR